MPRFPSGVLCWLLLCLVLHQTSGQRLTSAKYQIKSYKIGDATFRGAVVEATFDADLYLRRRTCRLSGGPNPSFLRCCTSEQDSGCHRPPRGSVCLDNAGLFGILSNVSDPVVFDAMVTNPTTCDVAVLAIEAVQGDPQVYFSFSELLPRPDANSNHLASVNTGTEWLEYCCASSFQTALEAAGSPATWNGRIIGRIVPAGSFVVANVFLDLTPKLNMTRYWRSVAPSMVIQQPNNNVGLLPASFCRDDLFCGLLAPSDDPVSNDFRVSSPFPQVFPYKPRTHSFALVLQLRIPGGPNGLQVFEPIPESFLTEKRISLRYDLLETIDGLPVANMEKPEKFRPSCSASAFASVSSELRSTIKRISDPGAVKSQADFQNVVRVASSYVLSDAWTACEEYARTVLLAPENQTVARPSFTCTATPGTPTYAADPCCNINLARSQCCRVRTVSDTAAVLAPSQSAIASRCSFPRCGSITATDYAALAAQDVLLDGCGGDLSQAIASLQSDAQVIPSCYARSFGQGCSAGSECPSGWCSPAGTCVVPCSQNSDCPSNFCDTLNNGARGCRFSNESSAQERSQSGFLNCVLQGSDSTPLFESTLRERLQLSQGSELQQAFYGAFSAPQCTGPFSASSRKSQAECEVNVCNWANCSPSSSPNCTAQNCVGGARSTHFCGECHGSICIERSEFGGCYAPSGPYRCDLVASGASTVWPSGECLLPPSFDGDSCFLSDFCPNATNCARAYCYDVKFANASVCNSSSLYWISWQLGNGTTVGKCVRPDVTTASRCISELGLNWWPGVAYRAPARNFSSGCVGECLGRPDLSSEASCNSAGYCDGFPAAQTEATCAQPTSGSCSDSQLQGCIFPYHSSLSNFCQRKTELLCTNNFTQSECTAAGGIYRAQRAASASQCNIDVCVQPNSQLVSFMTRSDCDLCGGTFRSALKWNQAVWLRARWIPFSWTQRALVTPNSWKPSVDINSLLLAQEAAVASTVGLVFQSELYCRYDRSASALSDLACNCGEGERSTSCASAEVSRPIVAVSELCNGLGLSLAFAQGTLSIPGATTSGATLLNCSDVTVRSVIQEQFKERSRVSLSSSFLSRGQGSRITSSRFIKNANQVAVGEIVGDGVELTFESRLSTSAFVCLKLPSTTPNSATGALYSLFTIAEMSSDFTGLSILPGAPLANLNSSEICVNISRSIVLFPIAVTGNYQAFTFYDSLTDGERAVVIIAALIYSALTVVNCYHLLMHLKTSRGTFLTLPKTALTSLLVFLTFRVIYFLCWPNGVPERFPAVGILFGEFPPIVFLVVYSVIVARWAQIYHFTMTSRGSGSEFGKLQPILFATDAILVVAFIILVILFFTLPSSLPPATCATPLADLNARAPAEVVAIVYKFFYAAVSLVMSGLFSLYGFRIMSIVRNSDKLQGKNSSEASNKKLTRLLIVTFICTAALVAQVINLIHSSFTAERNIYGVLVALLIIEVMPCIIFLNLFKVRSDFVQRVKDKLRNTFGTSRTMSSGNMHSRVISRTDSISEPDRNRIRK